MPTYYPLVMDLLSRQQAAEMRLAMRDWLARVGVEKGLMRPGRYEST
jgi:brefeldin A-inhibited guanine nucleotide-exchange protein